MRVLVVGDVHFCCSSSIVRGRGKTFSKRIENCVQSINYVEGLAKSRECSYIVYLGDFFDKNVLNSEELTAIQSISWSDVPKIILVGNHDMAVSDLSLSSAHILSLIPHATIIDAPNAMVVDNCSFVFLPYILEENRKPLSEYWNYLFLNNCNSFKHNYIFSHNDIRGIQMGKFISEEGFSIDEIESKCDLCFNGHIHNGSNVTSKIINVGNLTGQNFNEDASVYNHHVFELDTNSCHTTVYENPHALNFLRYEILHEEDLQKFKDFVAKYTNIVLSVKCINSLYEKLRDCLQLLQNVVEYRITTIIEDHSNVVYELNKETLKVNHIVQFSDYILNILGDTEIVKSELQKVLE